MSKPGKVLKGLCKKLGVRLTIKRGQKRVYKSIAVLKRQCANKKKNKKKIVKRRKARFGSGPPLYSPTSPLIDYGRTNMSSTHNQRRQTQALIRMIYPYQKPLGNNEPDYFGSGYNPFDIDNFSKNLLNDSIHDPNKMVELILTAVGDSLGTKSINYLIHNDFFKTRDQNNQMIISREIRSLSDYILGNYHKEVPFKREDIGAPLINKAEASLSFNSLTIGTRMGLHRRLQGLIKNYLWHSDLYEINWNDEDMNDYSSPLGTGLKTEECLRREAVIEFIREKRKYPSIADVDRDWIIARTRQKFENRQPLSIDEILQEINDRQIKAKDFFIREHMNKYTNEVVNNTNNLERQWGRYFYVNRGEHSVYIESFLKRKLKDYIYLCHRLRVQSLESTDTIKNTKNNGDISYNFTTNNELRLCTCEDLYYRKLSNNRAGRICKHLAFTPRETDHFDLNPPSLLPGSDNATPAEQMCFNILRLERPEILENLDIDLDDESYFGSPYVIEGVVRQRREISREIMEGLIDRNIVRSGEDHCYICLERPNFVIKNCPGQCKRSKICLDCIKQYPRDWYNDIPKIRCGMCREPLRDGQIVDFNIMKMARNFNQDIIDKIGADLQLNRVAPGLAKYVRSRPGGQVYFGKKKKKVGIPASLKKVCKRLKIRLTIKRKSKRVYKSVKVLKEQCKKALKKKKKVLRKSKAGKKRKIVKKKRKKVVKRKRKKVVRKRKKVVRKRKKVVKRKRKFGRNPTPSITKSPVKYNANKLYRHHVPSQKSLRMISGEPKDYQQYKSYKGSSSTYGF